MIYVTRTYLPDIEKYKTYISKIYKSGWVTNNGELVRELETKLKEYLGVKHIILVSNGTLALQIAYKTLNLSGEVITTPFSFVATTSSLVWEGLTPKYVDINPNTLNIATEKIEEIITPKTSGIVATHVFGNGCEVEKIDKIAKAHHLKVVYDGAHSFGIKYKDESIYNYGDISILSFHATKLFHTIEGGALVFKDDELYEKTKLMINFGIKSYEEIVEIGINAKMNEFQAAMGLCMLEDVTHIIENRNKVYNYYMKKFGTYETLKFQEHNKMCNMNYSYFPVVFDSEVTVLKVLKNLKENGIIPRRYFYPSLDRLPYINHNYVQNSNNIASRILCLPIYESLETEELEKITDIIIKSLNE